MGINVIISLIALVVTLILGIVFFALSTRRLVEGMILSSIFFLLIVEFSLFMIFMKNDHTQTVLWGKVASSSFCLLLPMCAVISHIYSRKKSIELLKNEILYLSLVFSTGLAFLFLVWKFDLFVTLDQYPQYLFVVTNKGKYFLVFALLFSVLTLFNLENTIRILKTKVRKAKRYPLYVIFGLFLFGVYITSQMLMFSRISINMVVTGLVIIILAISFFLIQSFKSGLSKFEVQIGREAVYSSVTIFIVGIYLLIIGIVGKISQFAGGSVNLFLSFLAALIVFSLLLATLVSKSLKQRIKLFIDRNFYKNRYNYREQWGKFSDSLTTVVSVEDVLNTIIENITRIFTIEKAAILLKDDINRSIIVRKTKNMPGINNVNFSSDSKFIDWFYRLGEVAEVSDLIDQGEDIHLSENEQKNLNQLQAKICAPMISQKKFVGILALGDKETSNDFTKEDYDLIETLANQSSVAILNAKLNEDLLISREMESFNKLSSFVLHDLKNSIFMLSMVIKNANSNWDNQNFQKDMLNTLSDTVNRMKSLVSKISSLPDKLEPKRKMIQINDLITSVINDTQLTENEHINLVKNFQKLPMIAIDADLFQKVLENLLINAIEALPNGGELSVSTKIHNGDLSKNEKLTYAEIEVSDTGLGMSEKFIQNRLFKPFQTTKKKGLGIGLYQCKEIIAAHGGKIEVTSKEMWEQNLEFFYRFPMNIINKIKT